MNRLLTFIFTFIVLTSFAQEKNCKNLIDGRYKIKYETKGFRKSDFELLISKNSYTKVEADGKSTKGQIDWISQCCFVLKSYFADSLSLPLSHTFIPKDSISSMAKALNSLKDSTNPLILLKPGIGYYELEAKANSRYHFRLTSTAQPHITLAEGKIIRLRN
jgi:hypothetical protein